MLKRMKIEMNDWSKRWKIEMNVWSKLWKIEMNDWLKRWKIEMNDWSKRLKIKGSIFVVHKYAFWSVYLFGFSLSPNDTLKVPK